MARELGVQLHDYQLCGLTSNLTLSNPTLRYRGLLERRKTFESGRHSQQFRLPRDAARYLPRMLDVEGQHPKVYGAYGDLRIHSFALAERRNVEVR